jgi:RecA-family ATPase
MTFEKEADEKFIPFLVEGGVLAYCVIIKKIHGKTVFLPVSFYIHTGDPTEILLYTMPIGNYPLYNANLIHNHKTAVIFLTDILDLVLFNSGGELAIFSSFYGGVEAVEKTDFSTLYGRDVYWLLLDKPGADPLEKYRIAIKVYMQLHEHGVNFRVVKFKNHTWNPNAKLDENMLEGSFDEITVIAVKEFREEAETCGVHIPEPLQENDCGLMTGSELEKKKQEPFIIETVLRRKGFVVVYADTGVGKSWAALSMALALVHGKSVFQDKWKTDGKIHKVLYGSGEMDDGEIGSRLKRLHEIYADSDTNKDNFILKLGTYHDLASPDDQEEFSKAISYATDHEGTPGLKVSVVVIDNLSTLTTNGEYAGIWNKFYRWICRLKEQGIAVIVIHHCNRQSDIAGTSQISNKTDKKIHALQASTNDNISLVLKAEKNRSEPKSSATPFKAEIDLSAANTGWRVTEVTDAEVENLQNRNRTKTKKLKKTVGSKAKAWKAMTESERITAINDGWNRGDCNRQIAFNYNTSESTVSKYRQAASLRDSDLEKTKQENA